MENHRIMTDYIQKNHLGTDRFGNCEFKAVVKYESEEGNWSESTRVRFVGEGDHDGEINIDEANELNIYNCHLHFSANYSTYSYDKSEFEIRGSSGKAGEYIVSISLV